MADRPTDFRIAPIETIEGEVAEILEGALSHDGEVLNIFRVLAHHPKLLKRFNLFGGFILNKGLVPAREREIVILRVGWNAQAVYEFGQHTVIGKDCGLTDPEIAALAEAESEYPWSRDDGALVALADELCRDDCVGDETFAALGERWSEPEIIELVLVAGFYRLVSGFLNTMGVQLDEGIPGWPSAG